MDNAEIGRRGESEALEYLIREGFLILATNWRSGRYELDIVAQRGDVVHIVEVKCRKAGGVTTPEDAITAAKFSALQKAALAFAAVNCPDCELQFDLIAVEHSAAGWQVRYCPEAMSFSW